MSINFIESNCNYYQLPAFKSSSTPFVLKILLLSSVAMQAFSLRSETSQYFCPALSPLSNWQEFQSRCPSDTYENVVVKLGELGRQHKFKTVVEAEDETVLEFQDSVMDTLIKGGFYFKKSHIGDSGVPILYSSTAEPIGVMKTSGSRFSTWDVGDLVTYKCDHGSFAGVPPAFPIEFSEKNSTTSHKGTLVKWIPHTHSIIPDTLLSADIQQRQAIAILDMRLGNTDRNIGNFVEDDRVKKLYPVDHDRMLSNYKRSIIAYTVYADAPFTEAACKYIRNLNVNDDAEILRLHDVDEIEIRNMVIRTTFLKLAVDLQEEQGFFVRDVETTMEKMKLPSGKVGDFFNKYIYEHPLHKILNRFSAPYDHEALKEAFKSQFLSYGTTAKQRSSGILTSTINTVVRAIFRG